MYQQDLMKLHESCIFFTPGTACCSASRKPLSVSAARSEQFCLNDNYDSCPFYLAYLLRHSHPKGRTSFQEEFLVK